MHFTDYFSVNGLKSGPSGKANELKLIWKLASNQTTARNQKAWDHFSIFVACTANMISFFLGFLAISVGIVCLRLFVVLQSEFQTVELRFDIKHMSVQRSLCRIILQIRQTVFYKTFQIISKLSGKFWRYTNHASYSYTTILVSMERIRERCVGTPSLTALNPDYPLGFQNFQHLQQRKKEEGFL